MKKIALPVKVTVLDTYYKIHCIFHFPREKVRKQNTASYYTSYNKRVLIIK